MPVPLSTSILAEAGIIITGEKYISNESKMCLKTIY